MSITVPQHDAEAGVAAHHASEGGRGFGEGEEFVHRADAREGGEIESVFGVGGGAGGPAADGLTAAEQLEGGDGETGNGTDDDEFAVVAEAAENRLHGRGIGDRGEDDLGAAEALQFGGRVLGLSVDVVGGAELADERRLVLPSRDGNGVESHFGGELDAEVPEAPDSLHGDEIAGAGGRVTEGIEGGEAGAHERGCFLGSEGIGDAGESGDMGDDVRGVAAILGEACDAVFGEAAQKVAAAAVGTVAAVAGVPADADAIADFPVGAGGKWAAYRVNDAGEFVTGDHRVSGTREVAGDSEGVAVADAAGLDADAYGGGAGRGEVTS